MKKLFFISLIVFISCQENKQSANQSKSDSLGVKNKSAMLAKADPKGKSMIDDLINKKGKFKFKDIVWATFDKAFMLNLYQDAHVIGVKFFVGVFPSDDPDSKKQDAPVIILQVKRDDIMVKDVLTTGYVYYTGNSYCPPPNDSSCGTVE